MIQLDDGTRVTAEQISQNGEFYDGRGCCDPLEPEYVNFRAVAKIHSGKQQTRRFTITSMAHRGERRRVAENLPLAHIHAAGTGVLPLRRAHAAPGEFLTSTPLTPRQREATAQFPAKLLARMCANVSAAEASGIRFSVAMHMFGAGRTATEVFDVFAGSHLAITPKEVDGLIPSRPS